MTKPGLWCAFLAAVSALAETPDAAEQSRALAAIRDYALNYTARLPDFTCTQITQRTYFPVMAFKGHPQNDSFEEQIVFADHKETYTVKKINGEAVTNIEHDQLRGTVSSGEFGSLLAQTLDPKSGTDFHWERSSTQKGQKVYVFAFRVPQARGYALIGSQGTTLVPYKGLLFADPKTGAVLRIEMQCEIPKDSEYKLLELTLDYRSTDVADHEFILPSHYHLHSIKARQESGTSQAPVTSSLSETTNEVDYKAYRRFDTNSSVTFGNGTNPKQ
jgi:hypothetical protein